MHQKGTFENPISKNIKKFHLLKCRYSSSFKLQPKCSRPLNNIFINFKGLDGFKYKKTLVFITNLKVNFL